MTPLNSTKGIVIEKPITDIENELQKIEAIARKVAVSIDSFARKTLAGAPLYGENYPFQACSHLTKVIEGLPLKQSRRGKDFYHWTTRLGKIPRSITCIPQLASYIQPQESPISTFLPHNKPLTPTLLSSENTPQIKPSNARRKLL